MTNKKMVTLQKVLIMEHNTGIRFGTDIIGRRTHVRTDLRKLGNQITPFLEEVEIVDNDRFHSDWQRALNADEFKQEMYKRIDAWTDK